MVEDAVGEVVSGVVEALADIGSSADVPKRHRKGCWWLTIIVALIGIALLVIAYS